MRCECRYCVSSCGQSRTAESVEPPCMMSVLAPRWWGGGSWDGVVDSYGIGRTKIQLSQGSSAPSGRPELSKSGSSAPHRAGLQQRCLRCVWFYGPQPASPARKLNYCLGFIGSALVRPACSSNSPQSGFYVPASGDGLPSTPRQGHRPRTGSAWPQPHAARVHRPRTRGRPAARCTSRVTGPVKGRPER